MSTKSIYLSRRNLFKTIGIGLASIACGIWGHRRFLSPTKYTFSGSIVGANFKVGHLLRTGVKVSPTETNKIETLIIGGGISGLSAAWWFKKKNYQNFILLEMALS